MDLRPYLSSGSRPSLCLPHTDTSHAPLPAFQKQASFMHSMRGCEPRPKEFIKFMTEKNVTVGVNEKLKERDALFLRPCERTDTSAGRKQAQGSSCEFIGARLFKCLQCQKSFSMSGGLETHFRTHKGVKLFKYLQCPKSFRQSRGPNMVEIRGLETHFQIRSQDGFLPHRKWTRKKSVDVGGPVARTFPDDRGYMRQPITRTVTQYYR